MPERIFGEIPGVDVGTVFPDRRSLSRSGVHRPTQAGISGSRTDGADSIVVSGGYVDDKDYGDLIIYTGQGGNDPNTRRQVADQEFTRGNIGLAISCDNGRPVRVIRGARGEPAHSPDHGYRYDGLFSVTRYWSQRGADRFLVWQFELCRFPDSVSRLSGTRFTEQESNEWRCGCGKYRGDRYRRIICEKCGTEVTSEGAVPPARRTHATVQRLVRNTAVGSLVKAIHDYTCQICRTQIETLTGPYAEAAHIRPLGRPHNGPDTESNVLCLCPNCHVQFDRLALYVEPDGGIHRTLSGERIGMLRSVPAHHVDPAQLTYQKALCRPDGNQ